MPVFQVKAIIIENSQMARDIWRMKIYSPEITKAAYPGQFLMLRVRDELLPLLRRPFSFSTINVSEGIFSILYKVVGHGTRLMTKMLAGESVGVLAPLGRGFSKPPDGTKRVWLLAGGIGIAPFFALLEMLKRDSSKLEISLFYGAATGEELVDCRFFENNNCKVNLCTDDGTCGLHGLITDSVERACSLTILPDFFYSCGPTPMQSKVIEWAKCNGIRGQVSMETYMACGMGVCLGCSISKKFFTGNKNEETNYLRVCREGPVFSIGEEN